MKIIINQSEIEDAIKAHVGGLVSVREGTDIGITFASTRGEDGIVATIDINYLATTRIAEIADAVQAADTTLPPQRVTTVATGDKTPKETKTRAKTGDKKSIFEDVKNPETAGDTKTETEVEESAGTNEGSKAAEPEVSAIDPVDAVVTTIAAAVDGEEAPPPTGPKKSLFS